MRFKINFAGEANSIIPIDYQRLIAAWIYHVIAEENLHFSTYLHDVGYRAKPHYKSFKLFNFSPLIIKKDFRKVMGDRLILTTPHIALKVSFDLPEISEHFIQGLFSGKSLKIKDHKSTAYFEVQHITTLPSPDFSSGEADLMASGPVLVSQKEKKDKNHQYLPPNHENYGRLIFANLIDKYVAKSNKSVPPEWEEAACSFELHGESMKQKLITTSVQPKIMVKAFQYFKFHLKAPPEILTTAYLSGLGKNNALGFGWLEQL